MGMILMKQSRQFRDFDGEKILIPFTLSDDEFFDNIQENFINLTHSERHRKAVVWQRIKDAMLSKGYEDVLIDFRTMTICVEPLAIPA